MNRFRRRPLLVALAAIVAACSAQSPPPAAPTAVPATATASVAATPAPSASPSPAATVSFAPTPSASASSSPSASPSASPTLQPGVSLAVALDGRLRNILDEQRAARKIPGLAAAIIYPDGSTWGGASGQAQLNPARRATAYTPYGVGSITKTFVSATIMDLAEEGALALDDYLSEWLPAYPRAGEMTLRHLLSHTSGVHNYFEHTTYNTKVFQTMTGHAWTPQEILDTFAAAPYFAPGAGYRYSNTNFILLGMVIELETGMPLAEVLEERFLTPLALGNTYFQSENSPPPTSAHGYLLRSTGYKQISDGTNYRPTISAATVAWAAGAIVGTPRDIARWAHELYGGSVLEPESLAAMTDYTYSPYAKGTYGLGTRTRVYNGVRMFGHTGSLRGFVGAMWHYEETGLTIVVLTNRGRIDANPIVDALAAAALPAAQSYSP